MTTRTPRRRNARQAKVSLRKPSDTPEYEMVKYLLKFDPEKILVIP